MASGIARGRVRTTTTTTTATTTVVSRKMAAILQIIGWQRHATLVYCVLLWYWTSMLWSIDTWPVSRDHIAGSSLQLIEVKCFFQLTADQVLVFRLDRGLENRAGLQTVETRLGRIVRKPVNVNPGLNINQIIAFSSFQMFLLLCFVYMVIIETENRRPNNIRITKLKSKFYFFLG